MKTNKLNPLNLLVALSLSALLSLAMCAPLSAKNPAEGKATKPIAQQLLGWWEFDPPKMMEAMKRAAVKENGGEKLGEEEEARIAARVKKMSAGMVLEFRPEGIARAHQPEESEDAKYKILEADETTGKFTMELTRPEQKSDTGACKIKGNTLSILVKGDREVHLRRLTTEEAKARLATLKNKDDEAGEKEE